MVWSCVPPQHLVRSDGRISPEITILTSTLVIESQIHFRLTCVSLSAAVTINVLALCNVDPSNVKSPAVACMNQLGLWLLFINTTDTFCTCTDINWASLTKIVGNFFCRKSISSSSGVCSGVAAVATRSDDGSMHGTSFMSLLIRMSRTVIDNNLLTSEFKQLLRILISSICCKAEECLVCLRQKRNMTTYDGETIFDNFHGAQRKWQRDTFNFELNVESFDQQIANDHRQQPENKRKLKTIALSVDRQTGGGDVWLCELTTHHIMKT